RSGAVWSREGIIYGRRSRSTRAVGGSGRWYGFSRRDHGDEPVLSGEAVARVANGRDSACWFESDDQGERACDCGQQSQRGAGSGGGQVSQRSVLSIECGVDRVAAVARAARGHSTAGAEFCESSLFVKSA